MQIQAELEAQIRLQAFAWIQDKRQIFGDVLPKSLLDKGFDFQGKRITLIGPSGIWYPQGWEIPISISTSCNNPYSDTDIRDDYFLYHYRGMTKDYINHPDNVGLRKAMQNGTPLIYFKCIIPGKYLVVCPVKIENDNQEAMEFKVIAYEYMDKQIDELRRGTIQNWGLNELTKEYATSRVRTRLHQGKFREYVIRAYAERCSFCQLRHPELLDAAHIIPDAELKGDPIIPNGISLCKIHHAAFDRNFIGIRPDYKIEVNKEILSENDGPMLQHGIKELHNKEIFLPRHLRDHPDKNRLEKRYAEFKSA